MANEKPKTLIDMVREVEKMLGTPNCSLFTCPNYGVVEGRDLKGKMHQIALFGPTAKGWRGKNKKIIAKLAEDLAAPAPAATVAA